MTKTTPPTFADQAIADAYNNQQPELRKRLLNIRALIFDVASQDDRIGTLDETLKWGVPSYLPVKPRIGTTVRLQGFPDENRFGVFVHCQTSLLATYRELYTGTLNFEGKRAIIFDKDDEIPVDPLRHCISLALTYHVAKR